MRPVKTLAENHKSPQLQTQDLVHHPLPEVFHVVLGEVDGVAARHVLGESAGEHAEVRRVRLPRHALGGFQLPAGKVVGRRLLVLMLLHQVVGEGGQEFWVVAAQ
jgi:hypothetical protein